jgi:hypothetical protein
MAFKPNPNKKVRWEELSKAELIRTVKQLDKRQTKLLNRIAELERTPPDSRNVTGPSLPPPRFPWESASTLPNPFNGGL